MTRSARRSRLVCKIFSLLTPVDQAEGHRHPDNFREEYEKLQRLKSASPGLFRDSRKRSLLLSQLEAIGLGNTKAAPSSMSSHPLLSSTRTHTFADEDQHKLVEELFDARDNSKEEL